MKTSNLYREIHSQPEVLAKMIAAESAHIPQLVAKLKQRDVLYLMFAARGTSDNAALYGKYAFSVMAGVPVALAEPSVYTLYHQPPRLKNTALIAISQSGESTDILAVLEEARRQGTPTIAITNRPDSAMANLADETILLHAGEEKAVAATKTYTTSLMAMALLAAAWNGDPARLDEARRIPEAVAAALTNEAQAQAIGESLYHLNACTVIGRGFNYSTAHELSLKLKELAYVRAEPYSPADFLHGPVAIVDSQAHVIVFGPRGATYDNIVEFAQNIRGRGGRVFAISDGAELLGLARAGIQLPPMPEWLSPVTAIVPGQLLAMALTHAKGYDLDHPRGLTKVTLTM